MRASAMGLRWGGVIICKSASGGLLAACLLGGAAAPVARAAVETWDVGISAALTAPALDGAVPVQCSIPSFDTQGGTRQLTGVRLSGTAEFVAAARVQNVSPLPWTATVQFSGGISLFGPGGGALTCFNSQSQTATDILPLDVFNFTNLDLFAPFTAPEPSPAAYATLGQQSLSLSGTFTAQLGLGTSPPQTLLWQTSSPQAGGFVRVEYTYTIIPAAAPSAALLTAGGLLAARRRRR